MCARFRVTKILLGEPEASSVTIRPEWCSPNPTFLATGAAAASRDTSTLRPSHCMRTAYLLSPGVPTEYVPIMAMYSVYITIVSCLCCLGCFVCLGCLAYISYTAHRPNSGCRCVESRSPRYVESYTSTTNRLYIYIATLLYIQVPLGYIYMHSSLLTYKQYGVYILTYIHVYT